MNINLENKKQIAIISLAVGLGLVAAVLVGSHIQSSIQKETAALAREYEEKKIQPLVQQVEMLSGELRNLASRQIAMQEQQQQFMQQGYQQQQVAAAPTPVSSLAIKTPAGKRALTVLVDSLSAVGGLINPGDFVDIMAHIRIPPPPNTSLSEERVTAILFQNMQILAVGTNLQNEGSYEMQQGAGSLNITLAVEPEEAGLLTFAQQQGRLQLVLRPPTETETQILQPASWDALAEYALDKNGMELLVPRARAVIQPVGPTGPTEEVKPYIQIFRGGREL